jgi:hypothetical protein
VQQDPSIPHSRVAHREFAPIGEHSIAGVQQQDPAGAQILEMGYALFSCTVDIRMYISDFAHFADMIGGGVWVLLAIYSARARSHLRAARAT